MRIVSGRLGGRRLATPDDQSTRPTSDRVRESLFNILAHHGDVPPLEGARVIDLFAGTGALGIEAVSRGAAYCLFVETAASARAIIRQNVEAFGLTGETRLFRRDATDLGPVGTMQPFSYAFLDPPYEKGLGEQALLSLAQGGWLTSDAIAILEERAGSEVVLPANYSEIERRQWGDTEIRLLRYTP